LNPPCASLSSFSLGIGVGFSPRGPPSGFLPQDQLPRHLDVVVALVCADGRVFGQRVVASIIGLVQELILVLSKILHLGCVSRREVSRCYSGWVYHCLDDVNIQVWTSVFRGCSEMEKKFSVEAKSFAFVALDGASVLRVVEKRNKFLGEVVLSAQCSNWLASTLEVLMGIPEDQEFVKSFREGSKILIARRGGNRTGRFLEATVFGLGGRKGFIIIPEGRGGWGWQKFSGELRKAVDFLSAMVGSGQGSSSSSTKKDAKVLGPSMGLASKWTWLSFAEVLCLVPTSAVNKLPLVGEPRSGLRVSPEEPGALDPLPAPTRAEQVLSSAVGCPNDSLVKDRSLDSLDKKPSSRSNSNFECSMMRTWSKLVNGLKVVLGWTIRICLGRLAWSGLGRKRYGFRLARLLPKPKAHTAIEPGMPPFPVPFWPEPSSSAVPGALPVGSSSSGFSLARPPPRGLEAVSSGKGIAVPGVSFAFPALSFRPETLSPAVSGAFPIRSSSSGGGSSSLKVDTSRVTGLSVLLWQYPNSQPLLPLELLSWGRSCALLLPWFLSLFRGISGR
jgi:hypothetical protein